MIIILSPYSLGPNVNHAGGVFEYYRILNLAKNKKTKVYAFEFDNSQILNIDFQKLNLNKNNFFDFCIKLFPFLYVFNFINDLSKIQTKKNDIVYVEWGEFALAYFFIHKDCKKYLILHDVLSKAIFSQYQMENTIFRKALSIFRYIFIYIFEYIMYRKFDKIFVYSNVDSLYLENKLGVESNKILIQKPIIFKEGNLNSIKGTLTIFGNFYRTNNLKSLIFLVEKVLPLVKANYILKVIGEIPDDVRNRLSCQKIFFTGNVDNYEKEIKTSYINLAPLFISGGIFKKIIDSMKYGIPTISTSIGAESFPSAVKKNILIADDEIETAKIIDNLILKDNYYNKVSFKSKECIIANFNLYNE